MQRPLTLALAAASLAVSCRAAVFTPGETEVVVAADAPKTVLFAVEELTNFLARALGAPVPVADFATPGKKAIFLGDSEEARKAGIDVSAMKRDARRLATTSPTTSP